MVSNLNGNNKSWIANISAILLVDKSIKELLNSFFFVITYLPKISIIYFQIEEQITYLSATLPSRSLLFSTPKCQHFEYF